MWRIVNSLFSWNRQFFMQKTSCILAAIFCIYPFLFADQVLSKSLYVIGDINRKPTPVLSYDIQDANLVYQSTHDIPSLAGGAVGITIDTDSSTLFITYEFSNTIQLVDANSMTSLGTTTAPGAYDLAGIVVDQGKSQVYTVDRNTNNLYVYSWNAWSNTLTLISGASFQLNQLGRAFGIALDESNQTLFVADYDGNTVKMYNTGDWSYVGEIAVSHNPIGIAIDVVHQFVYTGSGWGGSQLLC